MEPELIFGIILSSIVVLFFLAGLIHKIIQTVQKITQNLKANKSIPAKNLKKEVETLKTVATLYDTLALDLAQKLDVITLYQNNRIEMLGHIMNLYTQNIKDGETMTAVILYYISGTSNKTKQLFVETNPTLTFDNKEFKDHYESVAISLMKEFKNHDDSIEKFSNLVISRIQQSTIQKNECDSLINKWFDAVIELILSEKHAYVNKNEYTILDYLLYEYFNLYIAFCRRVNCPETSKNFNENFFKKYVNYAINNLKMTEIEADNFYWNRIEKYNKIMMSETTDKDEALLFEIQQFIKKSFYKTPFEEKVLVCDVFKSLALSQEINSLYSEVCDKTLHIFQDICALYNAN